MAGVGVCRGLVGPASDRGDAGQSHLPVEPFAGTAELRLQQVVQAVQPHGGILFMQLH